MVVISQTERVCNQWLSKNAYYHSGWWPLLTCCSYLTSSFTFCQCTCARSMDCQAWHSLMSNFITSVNTEGSTNLTNRGSFLCMVCWWILATWLASNLVFVVAHTNYIGSVPSLCTFNHLCGTLVRWSTQFRLDLNSVTSIKLYSATSWWCVGPQSLPFHKFCTHTSKLLICNSTKLFNSVIQYWTDLLFTLLYDHH